MAGVVFTPRAGVHSEFRKEKKKMTDTKKNLKKNLLFHTQQERV